MTDVTFTVTRPGRHTHAATGIYVESYRAGGSAGTRWAIYEPTQDGGRAKVTVEGQTSARTCREAKTLAVQHIREVAAPRIADAWTEAHATSADREIDQARRRVDERLAELADAGTSAPPAALEAYARGEFRRALAWLRQDVIDDLEAGAVTPRADGSHAVWGLPYAAPARQAESGDEWPMNKRRASLAPAGSRQISGLCLRTGGPHVGHMHAVSDECRTQSPEMDAYDAAAEARGHDNPSMF